MPIKFKSSNWPIQCFYNNILIYLLYFICFQLVISNSVAQQIDSLTLLSAKQLQIDDSLRFDLSGMVQFNEQCVVISDKNWNTDLYVIKEEKDHWSIQDKIPHQIEKPLDLEAIAVCDSIIYISNEANHSIYKMTENGPQKLALDWKDQIKNWKKNTGLEAIAVDCDGGILYALKERSPRFIAQFSLSDGQMMNLVDLSAISDEDTDFCDALWQDGYLYILLRNACAIVKVNPKTFEVIHIASYANNCKNYWYSPTFFGMAEALWLTNDEIWIGLDNNGLEVSPKAAENYKLQGTAPLIIKLKRPAGF